jgi:hypothetical protein
MEHFDFDNCPKYRALSYTWGPKVSMTQLNINGESFPVSQGLGTFMERARNLDWLLGEPGYLWIDQICINQKNVKERNNQVSFMGEIYQKAIEVLVWLGPTTDGCMRAIDAMKSLDLGEIQKNQVAIQSLFRRAYWTRLWIVQEVLLSRHGKVLAGKSFMAWSVLTRFMDMMLEQNRDAITAQNSWPLPNSVISIFMERDQLIEHRTLSSVLELFGDFQCQDIRDRVFGLQSLIPKHARVPIDYSISPRALWSVVVEKVARDECGPNRDWLLAFATRLNDMLEAGIPAAAIQDAIREAESGGE